MQQRGDPGFRDRRSGHDQGRLPGHEGAAVSERSGSGVQAVASGASVDDAPVERATPRIVGILVCIAVAAVFFVIKIIVL